MSSGELACTYACLILHDDGIPITPEKISTLVKAANVNIESLWPGLFAKLAGKRNIDDLILNAGVGGSAIPVPASAPVDGAGIAAAPPPQEKKEEKAEDNNSEEEFGFSLFD